MPDPGRSPAVKETSVVVLIMSAIIHIVNPQNVNVFGEYTHTHVYAFATLLREPDD